MNYYTDCSGLMRTLQGDVVVAQLEAFNNKCIRRYDVPELIAMIQLVNFSPSLSSSLAPSLSTPGDAHKCAVIPIAAC